MTFRERCALAAMERVLAADAEQGFKVPERTVGESAWLYADAMESERAKRGQAEAPEMPEPAPEHELPKTHAELGAELGALLMNVLAKAEAENAKLRAVAEAARHAMSVGPDFDADVALMGALDAWRKDWRTK